MRRILYVGWLGFRNIGDELMWLLFRDLVRTHLPTKHYDVLPSIPGVELKNLSPYDTIVLGGGSLLVPGYLEVARRAAAESRTLIIWGTGHDTEKLPDLDPARGMPSSSLAYTGELAANNDLLREAVAKAVYTGVRGPLTYRFLQDAGADASRAEISGDPAFLLPAPLPAAQRAVQPPKRPTVAVNWGTAYNRIYGSSEAAVEDQLAAALTQLLQAGYDLHLYPVWGPDRAACERLRAKVAASAPGRADRIHYDPALLPHEDLIERLAGCAFSINFKLHASYLSAAAGVPFICLGYRFKALDFGQSIGLSDYILPTHLQNLADTLLDRAGRIERDRAAIVHTMLAARRQYQERLERPFRERLL